MLNPILTAGNQYLAVTNLQAAAAKVQQATFVPLGTPGDSATGPIGVKVLILGSSGIPISTQQQGGDVTVRILAANGSATVPANAVSWQYSVLTGTATVAGTAGVPAGLTDSSDIPTPTGFTITAAAASTAYVRWSQ